MTKSEPVQAKLFNRYKASDVAKNNESLEDVITVSETTFVPHSAGRWQKKRFHKIGMPITERLVAAIMFHGRNNGKKLMAIRHVEQAYRLIELKMEPDEDGIRNPVQVLYDALVHAGPREDSCRVGNAGIVRLQAVDVSPLRRVNQAIYLIVKEARKSAFRNIKSFSECLADELLAAADNSPNSGAVKKREEIERAALSNR